MIMVNRALWITKKQKRPDVTSGRFLKSVSTLYRRNRSHHRRNHRIFRPRVVRCNCNMPGIYHYPRNTLCRQRAQCRTFGTS